MVLPGHLAGGYITTTIILNNLVVPSSVFLFSTNELTILYLIGILAGEIPDIDLLFFYFSKNKIKDSKKSTHREFITHMPLFWIFICLIIFGIGIFINSKFTEIFAILLLGGTLSHFIFDSIEYGISWLRPLSQKRFSLFKSVKITETVGGSRENLAIGSIAYYWDGIKKSYIKSITLYFEITVVIIALVLFLTE